MLQVCFKHFKYKCFVGREEQHTFHTSSNVDAFIDYEKQRYKKMTKAKKKRVEKEILEVIEEYKITRITHIFAYYGGISRPTFYAEELDKSDTIKEALEKNRLKACSFLHNKWIQSDNPTLQIAAFKLLCDDDERQKLTQNDVTTKGEKIQQNIQIEVIKKRDDKDTDQ